jgi:hypothetical protein
MRYFSRKPKRCRCGHASGLHRWSLRDDRTSCNVKDCSCKRFVETKAEKEMKPGSEDGGVPPAGKS